MTQPPGQPPSNSFSWRLTRIEEELNELKKGQPAVIAERVTYLSKDVVELSEDLKSLRRVLMGFLASFAFFGITIVVAVITLFGSGT